MLKTYEVEVTYQDVQPEENPGELSETYEILAEDEFTAECLAIEACRKDFWTHEPIEAYAREVV